MKLVVEVRKNLYQENWLPGFVWASYLSRLNLDKQTVREVSFIPALQLNKAPRWAKT